MQVAGQQSADVIGDARLFRLPCCKVRRRTAPFSAFWRGVRSLPRPPGLISLAVGFHGWCTAGIKFYTGRASCVRQQGTTDLIGGAWMDLYPHMPATPSPWHGLGSGSGLHSLRPSIPTDIVRTISRCDGQSGRGGSARGVFPGPALPLTIAVNEGQLHCKCEQGTPQHRFLKVAIIDPSRH